MLDRERYLTAGALDAEGVVVAACRQLPTTIVSIREWLAALPGPITVALDPADMRRSPIRIGSAARIGFVGSWLILGSGSRDGGRHGPPNTVIANVRSPPSAARSLRRPYLRMPKFARGSDGA